MDDLGLVVPADADGVTLYSHVGTGNYHSETAKGYVDFGILTANRDIGQDLVKMFNFFTGPSLNEEFRKLLIAPETMREKFTDIIRQEAEHAKAGRGGRLVAKVNGLKDPEIVAELYRASMAGVEIDLFVRDIYRPRPGVDGLSENITVHSIVGRFLESSRIFYFENDGNPEWYVGSADWMTRNLDNRVEAVAPVESQTIRRQLRFILGIMFTDNRRRWVMEPDGSYEQVQPDGDEPIRDTQSILMEQTRRATDGMTNQGVVIDDHFIDEDLPVEPSSGANNDTRPAGDDNNPEVLDAHSEHWYVPDSDQYAYAVRTPEGDRRYFKTQEGATQLLERLYD